MRKLSSKVLVVGVGINDLTSATNSRIYESWRGILRRCYDENHKLTNPAYEGVTCCDEWLLLSNFVNDLSEMDGYDNLLNGKWCLDKDILEKGNKVYQKDKCCIVPREINSLFTTRRRFRGDFPIGVVWVERDKSFISQLSINGKQRILGYFKNELDAFESYKVAKENEIKRVAELHKGVISEKVYTAMINWKVDITD